LRGHLKNAGSEESGGSLSYVPKEKEKDTQLKAAIALLHGELPLTGKKAADRARAARFDMAPHASGTSGG
jgi:carboxyl-terminal processing protease